MEKYYIVVDGEKKGPYALSQLREMWKTGALTMDTKYATEGMDGWADVGELIKSENLAIDTNKTANLSPKEMAGKEYTSQVIKKNLAKAIHAELKDCPCCSEAISLDSVSCPHCGCNFYHRNMRLFAVYVFPCLLAITALIYGITLTKSEELSSETWIFIICTGAVLLCWFILYKKKKKKAKLLNDYIKNRPKQL